MADLSALEKIWNAGIASIDPDIIYGKKRPPSRWPTYIDFLKETLPLGWSATADHIKLIAEHLDAVQKGEIDRLAIHMPPRHGKCMVAGSKVLMSDGSYKKIEDISIRETLPGTGLSIHRFLPGNQVRASEYNGVVPCYEIITKSGRTLQVSHNHPLLTAKGWVQASDLYGHSHIALAYNFQKYLIQVFINCYIDTELFFKQFYLTFLRWFHKSRFNRLFLLIKNPKQFRFG